MIGNIGNSWNDTLRADKRHGNSWNLEYIHSTESDITHFFLPPTPWVAPLDSPLCLLACLFCVWPPCPLGWALFAPVWTFLRLLFFGLSKSDCFVVHLGSFVCVATGASVHRRGRCIGVSLPLANDTSLVLVLVCLSVDVTGALALPNSFCVDYLHVLHAPLLI